MNISQKTFSVLKMRVAFLFLFLFVVLFSGLNANKFLYLLISLCSVFTFHSTDKFTEILMDFIVVCVLWIIKFILYVKADLVWWMTHSTVLRRNFCFCDEFMFLNLEEQNRAAEVLNQSGCLNLGVVWFWWFFFLETLTSKSG